MDGGQADRFPAVGQLSDKQSGYVEKALRAVAEMGERLDALLELAGRGHQVGLKRKRCHMGAVVARALDAVRARAAAKGAGRCQRTVHE